MIFKSLDAGSEVGQNRGMVFVPEKGDQVMVGFEYGDPNRPYVMGSMELLTLLGQIVKRKDLSE